MRRIEGGGSEGTAVEEKLGGRTVEHPPQVRVVLRLRHRSSTHFHVISPSSQSDARRRDAMTSLVRVSPTNVSRQRVRTHE